MAAQNSLPGRLKNASALVAVALIGGLFRLSNLFQPLRYDETVSFLDFARQPLTSLLSDYRLPNNHIFHSLLVHAVTALVGTDQWAIRVPAFVAGCSLVPLTYAVAKRLTNPQVALLSAALAAGSGALTLYSINARGYSIVIAGMLSLFWILLEVERSPKNYHWPLFALITALGFWTVPVMLFPLGGVLLWAFWTSWTNADRSKPRLTSQLTPLAIATLVGGLLALLLYLPVILTSGLGSIFANSYVTPTTASGFLASELPDGLAKTAQLFSLGMPVPVAVIFLVVTLLGCVVQYQRTRVIPPLVAALLWSVVALLILRRFPFARVWLFLLPLCCIAAAEGFHWLLSQAAQRRRFADNATLPVGILLTLVAMLALNNAVYESRDTGTLYDAEALAIRIKAVVRPGDKIVVATWAPLMYWLERYDVDKYLVLGEEAGAARAIVVVNRGEGESVADALSRFGAPPAAIRVDTIGTFPRALLLTVSPR